MEHLPENPSASVRTGEVTLTVPRHPSMAGLARLTAGALASVVDISLDELDDINVLVSEMMALLTEHGAGHEIALRFALVDGAIAISGSALCASMPPLDLAGDRFELSRTVLATASSDYVVSHAAGVLNVSVSRHLERDGA
jgi:hypothetical protein